jgi:F420-dependent oxidoreductase-like protein
VTRIGYQIPNFTYPGGDVSAIFDTVVRQATEAEASGFDTVMVMDHFYQLPSYGPHGNPMLECYTLLGALARETSTVRLGALVSGNTYRNPALLAKEVTTLDVVSGGRAQLGIGAGWYEHEHHSLGFEFGTFTDRFAKLEESLRIVVPMLRGEHVTMHGEHYRVDDAVNSPRPISPIPLMIGGGGERKTLRLVARYADESNLIGATGAVTTRKLDALAAHCEAVGRDRDEITVSLVRQLCVAPTMEQARAELDAGFDMVGLDAEQRASRLGSTLVGDPDTVGEALASDLVDGVDGYTVNAFANGHLPGRVSLIGEVLSKVVAGR